LAIAVVLKIAEMPLVPGAAFSVTFIKSQADVRRVFAVTDV
jgi:hypothetical protein